MRIQKCRSFLLLVLCCIPAVALAQQYTVTDLGPLEPTGLNSWAQVVGDYNNRAYIWQSGGLRDLGVLPGGTFSSAAGINDVGMVAGTADGPGTVISPTPDEQNLTCSTLTQPFVWTRARGMQPLGTIGFNSGWRFAWCDAAFLATGINGLGDVIGYNPDIGTYEWGFLWTGVGGMSLFTTSAYQSAANDINNRKLVVGSYDAANFLSTHPHAVLWQGQHMTDLGGLGGPDPDWLYDSSGNGVNERGQVVGWSTTNGCDYFLCNYTEHAPHAVLWMSALRAIRDLGTLPGDSFSTASKINLFGLVIGSSGNTLTYPSENSLSGQVLQVVGRPFIWSERTGMRDLNTLITPGSGWVLNSATDINVWGQIVGSGTRNGHTQGYMLTPLNPSRMF